MKKRILCLLLLLVPLAGQARSPKKAGKELREYVYTLAGEEMAGRAAGTRGDTLASEYLRDFLDGQKGVKLLFDNGIQSFFRPGWFDGGIRSFNVAGLIEGRDPALKNEVIVIGAHYDHMGLEPDIPGEEPKYKYGADDNASGTAMVMALARQLARERRKLKRSVMIAFFGAEERGLVGSDYLTGHMPPEVPLESVACMVNFDMVGRLTPHRGLIFFGLGSAAELEGYLRAAPSPFPAEMPVNYNAVVLNGSDHASFYAQGVPAFMVFTGTHPEYHKSLDTADKINYPGMTMIYRYALDVIERLAVDAVPVTFQKADR